MNILLKIFLESFGLLGKINKYGEYKFNSINVAHGFSGALVFEFAKLKTLIEKYNKGVPLFYLYENVQSMPDDCRKDIERQVSLVTNFEIIHVGMK